MGFHSVSATRFISTSFLKTDTSRKSWSCQASGGMEGGGDKAAHLPFSPSESASLSRPTPVCSDSGRFLGGTKA